jgi:hypothetical protein
MQVKVVDLRRRALAWVGAVALVLGASSAKATTTLDWEISNISCGLFDSAFGTTLYGDCDSLSFNVRAFAGQTAFLRGTISYHYQDDGLPLSYLARFQTDAFGGGTFAPFESAGLQATGSGCVRPFCPNEEVFGVGFQTEILGLNDHPDNFSGSVTFETYASPSLIPFSGKLFIEVKPIILSAIPEPETLALMTCGLLGIALRSLRRTSLRRGGLHALH